MWKKPLIILSAVICLLVAFFWLYKKPAIAPIPQEEKNISVSVPRINDQVSNPILVKGKARVFENTFAYALKDRAGHKLYEGSAMTNAPDAGLFGDFTIRIPVPNNAPKELIVEVFDYSAKDGSVIDLVSIPVELASSDKTILKVFFNNNVWDPNITCVKTFSVEREVPKTQEVGYISLIELLAGPTKTEKSKSYTTSIPDGVKINSLIIKNGTAYADFNEALDYQIGGSCRVSAIRSQITATLKQFPTIKNVVISINGRTEDILQP